MKLTKKLLGIIAVIAVIGFMALPLTGCQDAGDDEDSSTSGSAPSGTQTDGDTPITSVSISITAPTQGSTPVTTATTIMVNFTNAITWSPAFDGNGKFKAGTVYTATITLTALSGFTFTGLTDVRINNNTLNASSIKENIGGTVKLEYTFPQTELLFNAVTSFGTWLASQAANDPATAYPVVLNVSGLSNIQSLLSSNSTKYVSLDLSGTTFASIGGVAFHGCTSLASVNIPVNVNSIGSGAFQKCTELTSVSIPANVTSIGIAAFNGCTNLASVTFATGSNIADASFGQMSFPEGANGQGGNTLKTAYANGKEGTYTRTANGSSWTKQ
ncbi:leucine-rich repeat domain-containing protein [Treponema sp. R6D11]